MIHNTTLDFQIIPTSNCKVLVLADTSYYNPSQVITNGVIQILVPGYLHPVELTYTQSGITILNSNTLGITNVLNESDLIDIPDGAYTAKISICPNSDFWFEKTFYRTCKLECKYDQSILLLDLNNCSTCFSQDLWKQISTARAYIDGVRANTNQCNIRKASEMYKIADSILTNIVQCKCWQR